MLFKLKNSKWATDSTKRRENDNKKNTGNPCLIGFFLNGCLGFDSQMQSKLYDLCMTRYYSRKIPFGFQMVIILKRVLLRKIFSLSEDLCLIKWYQWFTKTDSLFCSFEQRVENLN